MVAGGASQNQDFVTYKGDDVRPIFTVRNAAGVVVDISTVSEITWTAQRDESSSAVVTKTKSAGQIVFTTDGTNGQFQVLVTAADTSPLEGFYVHVAKVADATGLTTTVTVGRLQVGVKPLWTFDAGSIATSTLYQVRDLIGDTMAGEQLIYDASVNASIAQWGNVYLAGAECCRKIAAKFSREVDVVEGELKTNYSNKAKAYLSLASELKLIGFAQGGVGYAGGISSADKTAQVENADRVPPQFNLQMFDNLLPVGPVGNQTPTPGAPDAGGL